MKISKTLKEWMARIREYQIHGRKKDGVDMSMLPETVCLNCGTAYHGHFCPRCGQTSKTRRFNTHQTFKTLIFTFTKFDDKIWHTILDLCVRPGFMINDYLQGRRQQYVKSLQMLVCLVTIYILCINIFHIDGDVVTIIDESLGKEFYNSLSTDVLRSIYDGMKELFSNLIIRTLSSITLLAFTCYLFFRMFYRKKRLNYAEHFYTHVYANCIFLLINLLLLPVCILMNKGSYAMRTGILEESLIMMLIYAQIFRITWRRSFIAYFLAYMTYLFLIIIVFCLLVGLVYGFENVKANGNVTL